MVEPISKEGYDLLSSEFRFLLEFEKPKVAHEKLVAAALGDRSENADYQAAKEKLRHIDKRLFYLNSMITKSQIIDSSLNDHKRVSFGSSVKILDFESDQEELYTICGAYESEVESGLISIHSPLAKTLMGKNVGDNLILKLPNKRKEFEIIEIFYINIFSLKKNIKSLEQFSFC